MKKGLGGMQAHRMKYAGQQTSIPINSFCRAEDNVQQNSLTELETGAMHFSER